MRFLLRFVLLLHPLDFLLLSLDLLLLLLDLLLRLSLLPFLILHLIAHQPTAGKTHRAAYCSAGRGVPYCRADYRTCSGAKDGPDARSFFASRQGLTRASGRQEKSSQCEPERRKRSFPLCEHFGRLLFHSYVDPAFLVADGTFKLPNPLSQTTAKQLPCRPLFQQYTPFPIRWSARFAAQPSHLVGRDLRNLILTKPAFPTSAFRRHP
jgi:hypothetical protein